MMHVFPSLVFFLARGLETTDAGNKASRPFVREKTNGQDTEVFGPIELPKLGTIEIEAGSSELETDFQIQIVEAPRVSE